MAYGPKNKAYKPPFYAIWTVFIGGGVVFKLLIFLLTVVFGSFFNYSLTFFNLQMGFYCLQLTFLLTVRSCVAEHLGSNPF